MSFKITFSPLNYPEGPTGPEGPSGSGSTGPTGPTGTGSSQFQNKIVSTWGINDSIPDNKFFDLISQPDTIILPDNTAITGILLNITGDPSFTGDGLIDTALTNDHLSGTPLYKQNIQYNPFTLYPSYNLFTTLGNVIRPSVPFVEYNRIAPYFTTGSEMSSGSALLEMTVYYTDVSNLI